MKTRNWGIEGLCPKKFNSYYNCSTTILLASTGATADYINGQMLHLDLRILATENVLQKPSSRTRILFEDELKDGKVHNCFKAYTALYDEAERLSAELCLYKGTRFILRRNLWIAKVFSTDQWEFLLI